jgi:hypothetical protein
MNRTLMILVAAALWLLPLFAAAQATGETTLPRPTGSKTARAKSMPARPAHDKDETKSAAAPCARGAWKDDPVCFGENDKDALPLPSAGSVQNSNPSPQPTIKPTANVNPRPSGPGSYQAGVVYQPNGNAVTSNYGGGISLQLPF